MTRLSGEFQTDLARPDALTACVDALVGLEWQVESVELDRIISIAGADAATVEVDLGESDGGTDVRIVGADSEDRPLGQDQLVAVLDQARDAIGNRIEEAVAGDQVAAQEPEGARRRL